MNEPSGGSGEHAAPRAFVPRWPDSGKRTAEVVYDVDHAFHDLYDRALVATQMPERMLRRQRHYLIPQALRRVARVDGAFAEIGCYRGLSAYVTCSVLTQIKRTEAFHVFDSFAGLSSPTAEDFSPHLPKSKDATANPFACSEAEVQANLADFPFVKLHAGWIPDRFADVADLRFAYVHVDVDLYEPTREVVAFFWPRMNPGGVMILDDYATLYYPGARLAVDEILAPRRDAFVVETPAGSAAAIKLAPEAPSP